MKKFLLFSFLLLIGAYSSVVWGDTSDTDAKGIVWTVNSSGQITDCVIPSEGFDGNLEIPSAVGNITVTGIAYGCNAFKNTAIQKIDFSLATNITSLPQGICRGSTSLQEVIFGNNITSIGSNAFYGCTNLEKADLPSGIVNIGAQAFMNNGLKTINIPASLTQINWNAFGGCNEVTEINWYANLDVDASTFQSKTKLTKINFMNTGSINIPSNAFYSCGNLDSVNFGNNIASIGAQAFRSCSKLRSAILPNGVTEVGQNAFKNCGLKYLRLPSSLVPTTFDLSNFTLSSIESVEWNVGSNVPTSAFYGTPLKKIKFGNTSQISIGSSAFYGINTLTTVDFENADIQAIGQEAFSGCSSLTSATLPNTVETIGYRAFYNCPLKKIRIPESLTSWNLTDFTLTGVEEVEWNVGSNVPASAFLGTPLIKIKFGNTSPISIGSSAFYNIKTLTTVDFENVNIQDIGREAFLGCSSLTSATLPNSVKTIGYHAFYNCPLKKIRIPESLTSLDLTVFTLTNVEEVEWNGAVDVPSTAFYGKSLKKVTFGNITTNIGIGPNAFASCGSLSEVNFNGTTITSIGNSAFSSCKALTSLTLPESVSLIEDNAFKQSGLQTVTLSEELTTIGNSAFQETKITSITIPEKVTTIGTNAFRSCSTLTKVYFLPETVPTFTGNAFWQVTANYYVPCDMFNDYCTATNSPCKANITTEKCEKEEYPIEGSLVLQHNMEASNAKVTRSNYDYYPTITVGDYSLNAETLSIEWEFDAWHFYYFTLPFDCKVEDITMDKQDVRENYIYDWSAEIQINPRPAGWQILTYKEAEFTNGKSAERVYSVLREEETLKKGISYVFGLLNPANEGGDYSVKVTFIKDDSYLFKKDIQTEAESSYTESGSIERRGWNLYGNPYYWPIPLQNFGVNSGNVIQYATDESYATIDNKEGSYMLQPNEAVFIQVTDGNGKTIPAGQTPATNNAPARYANQRPIRLTLSHNNKEDDHLFIKSDAEASDTYVIGEDCYKMKNNGMNQIYTMVNDTIETAFNCQNLEGSIRTIPLGLTINNSGTFNIAVTEGTNFMPGTILKIRDTQSGAEYNLLNGPATITVGKGIIDDRYVIEVMDIPCSDEEITEAVSFSAFVRDGKLVVEGVEADDIVSVYDATGRMLTSFTATTDIVNLDLGVRGVYFVNVNGKTIKIVY